ncbi:hypothetical protein [Streptomyces sp. H27-H5]|uniref:hypothetical protein n=1 Tax=Streptomyces sp. H27-H5 TaxID=2996460 RepID=UPI00226E2C0A|nr:hypothetical protein [Streptomyces sp. H27-H5]MCY0956381.1 hypothetical protein [Streptomyces sp. H27-H5]
MSPFPRFDYEGDPQYLDLKNIPKSAVTVTVNINDEKLRTAVNERIRMYEASREQAIKDESYGVAFRVELKLKALRDVLQDAGVS